MSFDRPLWLTALPALVGAFWAMQRFGLSAVSRRQRRVALGIRTGVVVLLVLALAGFRIGSSGDKVAVVFLVDASDSVGAGGVDRALTFVEEATKAKRRGDLVSVVAFGREPRLEFGMTDRPSVGPLAARPDRGATDLSRALRLAAALFPEGTKRRIVVLTDGRETRGDARREAARLAREGIVIEGLTLEQPGGADALIEAFDGPARARRGEAYKLAVTVRSAVAGPAHLNVTRDGVNVYDADRTLKAGRTTIPLVERASKPGINRYVARLTAATDAVPQNNRASIAVIVSGPPRVLLVEGEPGEGTALAAALRAGKMEVDIVGPRDIPDLGELLSYSSTALVDVPVPLLSAETVATLKAAVTEAGAGLITVGGEDSYGLGGYRGSELESILPVDSEIKDPKRRPSVAEALVIDTSGSMGRCHCRGGAMGGGAEPGGINKTDISRAGAARAIRALGADDIVGVLAFNTVSQWVVPLQKLPSEDVVRNGLQGLTAAGGTNIPQALRTAVAQLKQTKAKLKHVILFTDGWTNQQELVGVADEVAKAGITLSVVATGEGTGDVLARMATAGKGRFYAGTNLTDVPQVMMQEAILASRNYINEGVYRAVISAETPVTETLTAAPPLLGYVATSPKSAATVSLQIGQDDPLLATWRAGLGTVSSWTSDAKARWSNKWVSWQGYRDFWNRAVRSTFAPAGSGAFIAEARINGDRLHIEVAGDRTLGSDVTAVARVLDPSLKVSEVTLERSGPGSFAADVPVSEEGTYLAAVAVRAGGALIFRDTVSTTLPYSAEYLQIAPDRSLVADLARATHGRTTIEPRRAFDPRGLRASSARRELWPFLAFVAALLLPVDIAARRLVVSREDLRRGLGGLRLKFSRRERRRIAKEGPREERIDRLLEAKRRAGRRGEPTRPPQE
jgi:Mg-chelatase subunit ChlD